MENPLAEEFKLKLEALLKEYPTVSLNVQHTIQIAETKLDSQEKPVV